MPNIEMIKVISEKDLEEATFICPTCFNKTMVFLDDNTQKCENCGTTGYFTKQLESKEVPQK
jgi:ribosomal protein S27E